MKSILSKFSQTRIIQKVLRMGLLYQKYQIVLLERLKSVNILRFVDLNEQ